MPRQTATNLVTEPTPLPPASTEWAHESAPPGVSELLPPFFTGEAAASATPTATSSLRLARRLEQLAERLRREGSAALRPGPSADRLDSLLEALLAGYLAGRHGE